MPRACRVLGEADRQLAAWWRWTHATTWCACLDGEVKRAVAGTQADNMEPMAKMRRGVGWYLVSRGDDGGV